MCIVILTKKATSNDVLSIRENVFFVTKAWINFFVPRYQSSAI